MKKDKDPRIAAIGQRLRELRLQKNYSSYETWSLDNDIHRMTTYRCESKNCNPNYSTLLRMITAHGISVREFFDSDLFDEKPTIEQSK